MSFIYFSLDEPTFGFDIDPDNCQSWPVHYTIDSNYTDLSNSEDCVRFNDLLPDETLNTIKVTVKNRECDAYFYDANDEKFIDLPMLSTMKPMLSGQDADFFDDNKMDYDQKVYMKCPVLNNDPMLSSTFDLTLKSQPNTSFANQLHSEAIHSDHLLTNQLTIDSNSQVSNKSNEQQQNDMHAERTTTNEQTTKQQIQNQINGPVSWAIKKQNLQPLRFLVPFNSVGAVKSNDNVDLSTPQIIDTVMEMDQTSLTPIVNEMQNFDLVDFIVGPSTTLIKVRIKLSYHTSLSLIPKVV